MRIRFAIFVLILGCDTATPSPREAVQSIPQKEVGHSPKGERLLQNQTNSPTVATQDKTEGAPTFNHDVAPIIYQHCVDCHQPGKSGPFPLLSYKDVVSRAEQIVDVTTSRFMPPWPPAQGYGDFVHERWMADAEINLLQQWVDAGAPEGDPRKKPQAPPVATGWHLGPPDLIVELPEPYQLSAEGTDVYRNFVLPVDVDRPHWVHGVEVQPDNMRVAHHAYVRVDQVGAARVLDAQEDEPGYGGMEDQAGIVSPAGCILSWQVGKTPSFEPEGIAWQLKPGMDLVMELHMQPSGKPEIVQPRVGLYFTETPPTRTPFILKLLSTEIDIPPGKKDYRVRMEYKLPVDVEVLSVSPHAHYLGKLLEGYADPPLGERIPLIRIPDWDYAWQNDYYYANPVELPRGTRIVMNYVYDNSAENFRNPYNPPQRVQYGPEATDEMGELGLQILTKTPDALEVLRRDYARWQLQYAYLPLWRQKMLSARTSEQIVTARTNLAKTEFALGRQAMGWSHLQIALQEPAVSVEAYYTAGSALAQSGRLPQAEKMFRQAIDLDSDSVDGHNGMGIVLLNMKRFEEALVHFQKVIELRPYETTGYLNKGQTLRHLERIEDARAAYEKAAELEPNSNQIQAALQALQQQVSKNQ